MRTSISTRHVQNQPIPGFVQAMHSTPQRLARPVPAVIERSGFLGLQGRQALYPLPPGRRSGQFGTLLGATGGYPNTLAPNERRLGQLRCARQGLVRVPESNTKYGGKRGITGGNAAPVMAPSISESSGIPKEKKLCGHPPSRLPPAVHRGRFLFSAQACPGETHGRLRVSFGWHVGIPVVLRSQQRQAAADFRIACPTP
jgi:hypothetical protein